MAGDKQDARGASEQVRNIQKYRAAATKDDVTAPSSLSSTSSTAEPKMPGRAECSSPKWDIKAEERHDEPRSADAALDEPAETRKEAPQEADPLPCGELPSSTCEHWCLGDHDPEDSIVIPPCISEDEVDALVGAIPHPPVTKETLEELELVYIQSNINLRIDINFDHDLHFTPISGEKGELKKKQARRYWNSLETELKIVYQHEPLGSCSECDRKRSLRSAKPVLFKRRLPVLFRKLKELLIILIPDRDQYQISQYLDVPLLLQEVSHGLLDIVRLARWLDGLLTSHCAPMRDVYAHEMAEQIGKGAETGDLHALVIGIEKLFQFLEAMKLDVANHQIRSFRYLLIDDTVTFQQDYFRSRIRDGELKSEESRAWYCDALEKHRQCQLDSKSTRIPPTAALVHGLLELCRCHDLEVPATLAYDHKRLKEIRMDFQDMIHLDICLSVFDQLLRELLGQDPDSSWQGVLQTRVSEMHTLLRNRIMDLTDGDLDGTPMEEIWLRHAGAVALELTRAAFLIWPGSTFLIPDSIVIKTTARLIAQFEGEHQNQHHASTILRVLEGATNDQMNKFQNMTILAISQAQKQWQQVRASRQQWRSLPETDDIARRVAHIATVHWRVWADLVYLESSDGREDWVDETDSDFDQGDQHIMGSPMGFVQQPYFEEEEIGEEEQEGEEDDDTPFHSS
ncbi:uncharacterized protein Z520_10590 [Fonsecaea multimorphosa CBS 102226]|uniref:Uncharacterized protein n=1 Tax=Fonsecaea multimorphosa CBS 102226 TaxID=1442371 RepID=A0A0D2JT62_9EURO|nr:uncharacterized protein Z520_10590 [Fonsecaea multimorphosa CBS 102226]KIX93684.1 hypothetical protein Z520_10590 [Fonsecaea multimorphosa CBS 102226]OAL19794.1 hypothetical protein AYO22_09321 [Fonsecaea multimorphosa]